MASFRPIHLTSSPIENGDLSRDPTPTLASFRKIDRADFRLRKSDLFMFPSAKLCAKHAFEVIATRSVTAKFVHFRSEVGFVS